MRMIGRALLATAGFFISIIPAGAEWRAIENVKYYAIQGLTGPELYASIGERGPKAGKGSRAIAHTNFKLTWRRDYQRRGKACVLTSAFPQLLITYTLPKPSKTLPEPVRNRWQTFIIGVETHERAHGDMIRDLVREIEKATVGLSVENDPQCRKIRELMTIHLKAISDAHQERNRQFDRVELNDGGKVHQLILALLNGDG